GPRRARRRRASPGPRRRVRRPPSPQPPNRLAMRDSAAVAGPSRPSPGWALGPSPGGTRLALERPPWSGKYDAAAVRPLIATAAAVTASLALAACGSEGIQLSPDDPNYRGAVLFAERCSGCHTLKAAGAKG